MRSSTSLRSRLLLSHLAVVGVAVIVLLVAGGTIGSASLDGHLRSMGHMMGGTPTGELDQLQSGINAAFTRALLWGALAGTVAAMAVAGLAASRVLRPVEGVRRVARRLANGAYHERVPRPQERELAALADDVNALAQALEETEQRRLRLIAEVAHELRTPVTTLKGYLEGILDGVFEADPETLAAAIGEAGRMERLAADLSALSGAEEGRIELRLDPVDLAALAGEVAERLRPQFDDQNVRLAVENGHPPTVLGDRDRLAQVLTNLIGNALSYTPAGGEVTVRSRPVPGAVEVEVSDTGRGLSPQQLELVFERFYRVDRSATGGSGIGLTIARALARLHGGDVTAHSAGLGAGSRFVVTIPIRSGHP